MTSGYVHAGRTNNTTYHYVVTAVNAGGESAVSSEASTTPAVNPAPRGADDVAAAPRPTPRSPRRWDPVAGATSYTVYEGGPTVSKSAHAAVVTTTTSPVVRSGLANGTAYYYVVTASNLNGESSDSARVSATPSPRRRPAGVVAVAGDARVTLTWTAVAGATACDVPGDVDRGHQVERHEVRGRLGRRRPDRPHERHDLLLRRHRGERGR